MLADLNLMGFLFESLAIRDLRIYAQSVGGRVLQYRDNTGLEIDAVLELPGQRWAALEIKLGSGMIEEAAHSLGRFLERVDTTKIGPPALAGVIVGSGYGYVRKDGIAVIPIGALGP